MPAPEMMFLFEDTFTADSWNESILVGRSDTLSPDRSSCGYTITVPYSKYKAAIRFILGYQWVDEANNLRRSTPVFHPTHSWLYASAITGVEFKGPDPDNNYTAPYPFAVTAGGYTWAEVTIDFRERLYNLWQDWEVDTEDERWTYQTRDPFTEIAQIDGGSLKAYAPGVPEVNSQPYLAAPYVLAKQAKAKVLLQWFQVPVEFVEDENGFSSKFQAAEKCVNDATFHGRIAGTWLLEHVHLDKKPAPVATDLFGGLKFTYDITFEFLEFNPPRGDETVNVHGHNLLPGPKSTGSTGDRVSKYYLYNDDGTASGKPLFASYSFPKLFTHYSLI